MKGGDNLIRVGIVSALDEDSLFVRVYYPQFDNLVSDWLPVLQRPLAISMESAGYHDHGEVPGDGSHEHALTTPDWMPRVNDRVLVAYTPGFSADGYVLGVIP